MMLNNITTSAAAIQGYKGNQMINEQDEPELADRVRVPLTER